MLTNVKMHYEDSHTSFAYSGYIPLWEITDGYVTFYPPKNVLDPVAWWRKTPLPTSGEFLSNRPDVAIRLATEKYIELYEKKFRKVSKEKFPVKDTVITKPINDPLKERWLERHKVNYKEYLEYTPQLVIPDLQVKSSVPIVEPIHVEEVVSVVKEYPSALGRKSTLMQEMIAADNDGREEDALVLLKELEELWAIPDNKNKSIPSVFIEIIKEIINDIQKN